MKRTLCCRGALALLAAGATALLGGCGPADRSGSVLAWVYEGTTEAPNDAALRVLPLENLESLNHLNGRDLDFRAGAGLRQVIFSDDPPFDRGAALQLAWTADAEGRVLALDEGSLYAMTAYRHLDRAASGLRGLGYVPAGKLDAYVFPFYDSDLLGDLRTSITDNAGYSEECRCFLLFPGFVFAGGLPLLASSGVMAHEYGHSVVHQLAGQPHGVDVDEDSSDEVRDEARLVQNHYYSMHEGVADLLALAVTGNARILDVIDASHGDDRDMRIPRSATGEDRVALEGEGPLVHFHGSTLARAVYEAWPRTGPELDAEERAALGRAVLATLPTLDVTVGFRLANFASQFVLQLPASARPEACATFALRLGALGTPVSACEAG